MSHFTVLVVTQNGTRKELEQALAPFHEFECTGHDDQYVKDVEMLEEAHEEYLQYGEEGQTFLGFVESYYSVSMILEGTSPDKKSEHKYGYCVVNTRGEVISVIDRTNPNAKWDWYTVGGRWSDFFLTTSGGFSDSLKKDQIDVEGMKQNASEKAEERYDVVHQAISPSAFASYKPFKHFIDLYPKDRDVAREHYHDQEACKQKATLRNEKPEYSWIDLEEYNVSKEAYLQQARDTALQTFAFLTKGEWFEKGDMGWFAIVSDEKKDWPSMFQQLWDEVPDDHYITLVDCHI